MCCYFSGKRWFFLGLQVGSHLLFDAEKKNVTARGSVHVRVTVCASVNILFECEWDSFEIMGKIFTGVVLFYKKHKESAIFEVSYTFALPFVSTRLFDSRLWQILQFFLILRLMIWKDLHSEQIIHFCLSFSDLDLFMCSRSPKFEKKWMSRFLLMRLDQVGANFADCRKCCAATGEQTHTHTLTHTNTHSAAIYYAWWQ